MSPVVRPKRFTFGETLRWTGEKKGLVSVEGKQDLPVATPAELRGHPGLWSPEDLFVAAADTCLMTTFLALAARKEVGVVAYASSGSGVVELVEGKLRFTSIVLRPRITVAAADVERARALIHEAEAGCLVSASMSTPVTIEPDVRASDASNEPNIEEVRP
jgi:organic hydroperoxide reductase OsmC/OhrA